MPHMLRVQHAAIATIASLAVLLAGCGDRVTSPVPAVVASVLVPAVDRMLVPGERLTLTARPVDAQGGVVAGRRVSWQSSDASVASVSAAGELTAARAGETTISATVDGVTGTTLVLVRAAAVRIVIGGLAGELEVGDAPRVVATAEDADGHEIAGVPVAWSTNAPELVTVVDSGAGWRQLATRAPGELRLTAMVDGVSATAATNIRPQPAYDLLYRRLVGTGTQRAAEILVQRLTDGSVDALHVSPGVVVDYASPSPDGTHVAFALSEQRTDGGWSTDLAIADRDGGGLRRIALPGLESEPAWSPDGTRIAFVAAPNEEYTGEIQRADIWVVNADGTGAVNLTADFAPGSSRQPAWSSDGNRIAFEADFALWTMRADGSDRRRIVPRSADPDLFVLGHPSWSPDGSRIAYELASPTPGGEADVVIVSANGGAPTRLALPGAQSTPAWSPDGEYLAFSNVAQGSTEPARIYSMRPDGSAIRARGLAADYGRYPRWIVRR